MGLSKRGYGVASGSTFSSLSTNRLKGAGAGWRLSPYRFPGVDSKRNDVYGSLASLPCCQVIAEALQTSRPPRLSQRSMLFIRAAPKRHSGAPPPEGRRASINSNTSGSVPTTKAKRPSVDQIFFGVLVAINGLRQQAHLPLYALPTILAAGELLRQRAHLAKPRPKSESAGEPAPGIGFNSTPGREGVQTVVPWRAALTLPSASEVELVGPVCQRRVELVNRNHDFRPPLVSPDEDIAEDRSSDRVGPLQDGLGPKRQWPVAPFKADCVGRRLTLREFAKLLGEGFLILGRIGSDKAGHAGQEREQDQSSQYKMIRHGSRHSPS